MLGQRLIDRVSAKTTFTRIITAVTQVLLSRLISGGHLLSAAAILFQIDPHLSVCLFSVIFNPLTAGAS